MNYIKNPALYIEKKLDFLKTDERQFEWAKEYMVKKGYINSIHIFNMIMLKKFIFEILSEYPPAGIEKFINLMITAWKRYESRKNKTNDSIMLNVNISKEHMKKFNAMSDNTMKTNISLLQSLIDNNYEKHLAYLKKIKSSRDAEKYTKNIINQRKNMEAIKLKSINNNLTLENKMLIARSNELTEGLTQLFLIIETSVVNESKLTAIDSINAIKTINSLKIKTLSPQKEMAANK